MNFKNFKKIASLGLALALVAIPTGCGNKNKQDQGAGKDAGKDAGEKQIVWKLSDIVTEDHNWNLGAKDFAKRVEEKTGGKLKIDIYPNSELGSEMEALNGILSGTVDMTISAESMSNWAPLADLMAAPYAYKNEEHIQKVLSSDVGDKIKKQIEDSGFKPLMYQLRTPRNLTSNKPISTPEEARGLKLRLSNTPLAIKCWEAVGANVNVMALNEVFTALNQGVIDSQENPYDMIYNSSFYEVQKYANETEHVVGYLFFIVGEKQFNALPEEMQKQVLEAASESQEVINKLYFDTKNDYKQKLIEKGMMINEDVDKDAFRKAMEPAIKEYFDADSYKIYEKVVELGKDL